jgi:hypothetical protein
MSYLAEILGIGAGAGLIKEAYDRLGAVGQEAFNRFGPGFVDETTGEFVQGLGPELSGMLEFQPYTVTTASGSQFGMVEDPETGQFTYDVSLSPDEETLRKDLLSGATTMFTSAQDPIADRETAVLERLAALRAPERERERLALEERLAAQGRLGTRTAMFGGTSEQLALAQAQEEQQARDVIAAMEFARADQDRDRQAAASLLEASYLPQGQTLAALEPGMAASERRREAMSEQAQTYGESYAAAINALLSSSIGQASLLGDLGGGLVSGGSKSLFSL